MKWLTFVLLSISTLQGIAVASSQQSPKSTIEGRIVNAATGNPLVHAQVTLLLMPNVAAAKSAAPKAASPFTPVMVMTDSGGKFAVSDLETGSYRVYATQAGFTTREYGQHSGGRSGTAVELAEGQTAKGCRNSADSPREQ